MDLEQAVSGYLKSIKIPTLYSTFLNIYSYHADPYRKPVLNLNYKGVTLCTIWLCDIHHINIYSFIWRVDIKYSLADPDVKTKIETLIDELTKQHIVYEHKALHGL